MKLSTSKPRILVFDCECRPTAWFGGDYVGRSITAVAWSWLDDDDVDGVVLTRGMRNVAPILKPFMASLRVADIVVGHYIRGFDLPLINGDLERLRWNSLESILSVDTKLDRVSTLGISESLENLVARYELEHEKIPMSEPYWEEHNLWQTPRSCAWVAERVEGDVIATKELYETLASAGRLKAPKLWDPRAAKLPRYRA